MTMKLTQSSATTLRVCAIVQQENTSSLFVSLLIMEVEMATVVTDIQRQFRE